MAIEINNHTNPPCLGTRENLTTPEKIQGGRNDRQAADDAPQASDTVVLTETAAMMQKIQARLADLPVVDSKRVEAIKAAIADGSYQVDSNIVAERMTSLEKQLA